MELHKFVDIDPYIHVYCISLYSLYNLLVLAVLCTLC